MFKLFPVIFLILLAFAAQAQTYSVTDGRAIRFFEEGENLRYLKRYSEALQKYQAAQSSLGGALSRLMVVAENYPQLKATESFAELQSQLEGTENRIKEERDRFNESVKNYNSLIVTFPGNLIASFSGFVEKGFFQAEAGSDKAPEVNFDEKK